MILVAVVLFVLRQSPSPNPGTIKIGSVLPLSADFGFLGEEINRGALIAVDEAHKSGIDVEYIPEDDAFDAAKSASAANKLISVDHVDAAFTALGEEAKPMAPIFTQAKVPLLVSWDSNETLKGLSNYLFSIG